MNRKLPQLHEYDVCTAQTLMMQYFLGKTGEDKLGSYLVEVLKQILRKGSYNITDKNILNGLRDRYMKEVVHVNDSQSLYYVVVDGTDNLSPIQAFKSMLDAANISEQHTTIYAYTSDDAVEKFTNALRS